MAAMWIGILRLLREAGSGRPAPDQNVDAVGAHGEGLGCAGGSAAPTVDLAMPESSRCSHRSSICWSQVGKRLTKVSMLSGSIVRVWGALEAVLVRSEAILSKSDRTMRIVRVATGDANSLIGEP